MQKDDVLLRMEGICKSFPGVKALDDAQLTVRPGTVHALMGENGAGKSTLMNMLSGIYTPDKGERMRAQSGSTAKRLTSSLPAMRWTTASPWCIRS